MMLRHRVHAVSPHKVMSAYLGAAFVSTLICFAQVSAQVSSVVLAADPGNERVQQGKQLGSLETQVTEEDVLLKPTLTVSPPDGRAYCEDTVLLRCGLHQYRGWKYFWYQHSRSAPPLEQIWDGGGGEAVLRLWRVTLSDTGQYWCRAGRGSPIIHTEFSDPVYLNITDYFSHVTLSLSPGLLLKKHEPFQLTCDAQVSERESQKHANSSRRAQATYTFYRNGQPFISSSVGSMVTVSQALGCHSGRYRCTATSGRAQRSSPELHVTTDGTSLLLVILVGTAALIVITLAAFAIRELILRGEANHVGSPSTFFLTRVVTQTAGRESAYHYPDQAKPAGYASEDK